MWRKNIKQEKTLMETVEEVKSCIYPPCRLKPLLWRGVGVRSNKNKKLYTVEESGFFALLINGFLPGRLLNKDLNAQECDATKASFIFN